jgi:3'-5' exoribonuclease 1
MNWIVDIRKLYSEFYKRPLGNLAEMLRGLDLTFQGREHSGIDDANNIYFIFEKMANDGCRFDKNSNIKKQKIKRAAWSQLRK